MAAGRDRRRQTAAQRSRRRQGVSYRATWPTRGQFAGCLVGQALGDALGCVVAGSALGWNDPWSRRSRWRVVELGFQPLVAEERQLGRLLAVA
jgi:hypothetical protein